MSFSSSFFSLLEPTKKVTKKEKFLLEMEKVIPWNSFVSIVEPHWFNQKIWRPRIDALLLLKIYFLQQWYALSDEGIEDEIWWQLPFQKFLDLNVVNASVPDATTIENFRHMLEEHELGKQFHSSTNELLLAQWIFIQNGTSVDATIIHAPSSTKNKDKKRDPEMHQTKKGNQWYHWMKAHVGTDTRSGIVHTLVTTAANTHDSDKFDECLHWKEKVIFADRAYPKKERVQTLRKKWITCLMQLKARKWHKLTKKQTYKNRKRSSVRSRCEHIFHIVKDIFHYRKVRYKWLKKNTEQLFTLFTLANLYKVRGKLLLATP
jgi:IS5 family transposase